MTLKQTVIIAAHSGNMDLIKDDQTAYYKYIKSVNRDPRLVKEDFERCYSGFSKVELAVIEIQAGYSLLKPEDKHLVEEIKEKYTKEQIQKRYQLVCLCKSRVEKNKETDIPVTTGLKVLLVSDSIISVFIVLLCVSFAGTIAYLIIKSLTDYIIGTILFFFGILVILIIVSCIIERKLKKWENIVKRNQK